jgi:hypothetical protein
MKRELAQSDIERQLRPFRRAAHNRRPPEGWLRALRQAFNLPAEDIASDLKLTPKMVFQLERSETEGAGAFRPLNSGFRYEWL